VPEWFSHTLKVLPWILGGVAVLHIMQTLDAIKANSEATTEATLDLLVALKQIERNTENTANNLYEQSPEYRRHIAELEP
jgi:hypothetical protein